LAGVNSLAHASDVEIITRGLECTSNVSANNVYMATCGGIALIFDRKTGASHVCYVLPWAKYRKTSTSGIVSWVVQEKSTDSGYCMTQPDISLDQKSALGDIPEGEAPVSAHLPVYVLYDSSAGSVTACINGSWFGGADSPGLTETACVPLQMLGNFHK